MACTTLTVRRWCAAAPSPPPVLVLFLAATGVALANDGIELPRRVLGGGASDSAVGGTTLRATLGQPVVGVVSRGASCWGRAFGAAQHWGTTSTCPWSYATESGSPCYPFLTTSGR